MTGLLTWKDGSYSSHYATADDGTELFVISWKSHRGDPNYVMRSRLPGLPGEWKHDDLAELQHLADDLLAAWLGRITGLPDTESEAAACEQAFVPWWENDADMGSQVEGLVSEGFAAGWQARARRGKGGAS